MRILIAQINPVVGDVDGNLNRILKTIHENLKDKPELIVFPELSITGYPPRDLLERKWLINRAETALDRLCCETAELNCGILVGLPLFSGLSAGNGLYNSAVLIDGGKVIFTQHKQLLPTYDVFDEDRYFDSSSVSDVVSFRDEVLGISICEDAWNDPGLFCHRIYTKDPIKELADKGATLMINLSASPYQVGKDNLRRDLIRNHARNYTVPFIFVNQVGGNDELIFDGRSMFVGSNGKVVQEMPAFIQSSSIVDTTTTTSEDVTHISEAATDIFQALVLGVRDYVGKCGFRKVLIGLSGGIDSAMVAAIAVEALGNENVTGMTMPGPFSSGGSVKDSLILAENLGIKCHVITITDIYENFIQTLEPLFKGTVFGVAEENIQARVRGNLLMAQSNKTGALVLTTGNKSEMAVGYCTLYGDMSGGLSVLSDVPKTWVYKLAKYFNHLKGSDVIPVNTIEKPPSAELRPDQKDQDSLPPYPVLDSILSYYVDEGLPFSEIAEKGYDEQTVRWIIKAVERNEYKRRQAAPGLKVTSKAFGVGRRMPVAAKGEIDGLLKPNLTDFNLL